MHNYIKKINSDEFEKVLSYINQKKSFCITGLTSIAKAVLISQLLLLNKKVLLISNSEQKSLQFLQTIEKLSEIKGKIFPYQDISLYETIAKNLYKYQEQIEIINNLENEKFIVTSVKSLFEKFPEKSFFDEHLIRIEKNSQYDIEKLAKNLVKFGYKRVTMVTDIGEFSLRGDILDVFAMSKMPVRIEFWADEIQDIRFFDNKTQKSIKSIDDFEILPIYKFVLNDNKNELPKDFQEKFEIEGYFEEISYFENVLNPKMQGLIDFIKEDFYIIFDEHSEIFAKYELTEQNYLEQKNSPIMPQIKAFNHITYEEFIRTLSSKNEIFMDNFTDLNNEYLIEFETALAPSFSSKMEEIVCYIENKTQENYKIIIATDYKSRLNEVFNDFTLDMKNIIFSNNLSLGGTILENYKLIILTDKELFNKKSKDIVAKTDNYFKENYDYIETINDIKENDYVVHKIHGIGKYLGLQKQEIDAQSKDYLTIEYQNGDKLYMPAEQINLLWRYRGSGDIKPKLSKMGGNDWHTIKSKVKKAVEEVAVELLKLYAKRKISKGVAFEPDTIWQYEMEEAFEYTETPDQMKSIIEVKSDMENEKPMDRLICGDVGFGKTEVAIRAIFKAVMSGKQVAVIVPTTILAFQHYETIKQRFEPFAIRVELLSRFRSRKEQKLTLKNLTNKECDVIIGTHRLLQNDVKFNDLGFLVIDEEHRFGVKDKERLKSLKENIDIISMSATPIPRTLYMSLSGIKDMSIINTPPQNRLPIKTLISQFDEKIIKNAINYELEREGQVYFLHNRVENILNVSAELQKIIPNAKIKIAHGQMDKLQLERVMVEFTNHEFDILVCTTIIESGLDIPNANTIIINKADKLGLAQLYQIRGRVGRSERQAYCYCLFDNIHTLTKEASSRLNAIKDFTTLGSGYRIALRDIEIRGIGNILGTKQHGNMVTVGFDTYCELLEEAVTEIKGEKHEKQEPAIVDINVKAFIPDDFVGSKEQKMIEYKHLADVTSVSELEQIELEWKDRFSKIPQEVKNLIELIRLRILATNARIKKIHQLEYMIRIYTPFTQGEWRILSNKLDKKLLRHIKFTNAPKSCLDGVSILLFDISYCSKNEVFEILGDFLEQVRKIAYEN